MINVLLLCSFYTPYVCQLWHYVGKYYPEYNLNLLTSKTAAARYVEASGEINAEHIFTIRKHKISLFVRSDIKQIPEFDIIQAMWIEKPWGICADILKEKAGGLYVEVGGSDLYREAKDKRLYLLQKRLIRQADIISSENEQTREHFYETYGEWSKRIPHRIVRFGVDVIDEIGKINDHPYCDLKNKYGIKNDKCVVMLGYNGVSQQQHLKMIQAISRMSLEILNNIFFVIPMTYGVPNEQYRFDVEDAIKCITDDYVILDDYLNSVEMAEWAVITDIMIHLQTTDQLSSTMMAHLFCGNVIITGSWLPYDEIREAKIQFWSIDAVPELTDKLTDVVSALNDYKGSCCHNPDRVYEHSSWEYCINEWVSVYRFLLNG